MITVTSIVYRLFISILLQKVIQFSRTKKVKGLNGKP